MTITFLIAFLGHIMYIIQEHDPGYAIALQKHNITFAVPLHGNRSAFTM